MRLSLAIKILNTAFLVYISSLAYSDDETVHINIPPSSRHIALLEFASQIGYDILFGPGAESKKMIKGLSGEYRISSALGVILQGSDLKYEQIGNRFRITRIIQQADLLPVVSVLGYLRNANSHISQDDTSLNRFPLYQVPLSIQSVSRKYIDDVQSRHVEDVLSYIGGVEYFGSDGGLTAQYYSRGVETPFSIDGKFYRQTTLALDAAVLERVDLVQGPSANFRSPGGLLNFVTKKPKIQSHSELSIAVGSEDFYSVDIDLNLANTQAHNSAFRLIGVAQKQKHIKKFAFREKFVLAPSLAFEFSNNSQLLFSVYYKSEELYPNIHTLHSDLGFNLPRDRTLSVPWAKSSIRNSFISADISNFRLNGWLLNAGANLNYSKTDNTFIFTANPLDRSGVGEGDDVGDSDLQQFTTIEGHLKAYGPNINKAYDLDLAAEKSLSLFGLSTLFRFGADYRHHTYDSPMFVSFARLIGSINIYDSVSEAIPEPPPFEKSGFVRGHDNFYGLFVSQSFYLPKSITVHTDFRYEDISVVTLYEYRADRAIFYSNGARVLTKLTKGRFKELTPQLGVNISFTDTFSSHISYRESFSFQQSKKKSQESNSGSTQTVFLSPVKNQQVELVLKKQWMGGELLSDIAFYNMKRSKIIRWDQDERSPEDDQFSKGFSISISGRPDQNLELLANINYNKNTTKQLPSSSSGGGLEELPRQFESDKQAIGSAKIIANTWVNYTVQTGALKNFSFGIGVKYVGERMAVSGNQYTLPAYTKYDGFLTYTGWKNLSLALSVRNFTDKYYYKSSLGLPELIEEGDPRSYYLSLKSKRSF